MDGDRSAKAIHNDAIGYQLFEIFGLIPVCVSHTKEYLRFYQGHGVLKGRHSTAVNMGNRACVMPAMTPCGGKSTTSSAATLPISQYMTMYGPDHATDIIENMVGGLGKPFYINTRNRGAVSNMAEDAILGVALRCGHERTCAAPRRRDAARHSRPAGTNSRYAHELTAEAVVKGDYALLRRAMMTDPLTNSVADADAILRELLAAEREALPDHWFS